MAVLLGWISCIGFIIPPWQEPDEPHHFEYVAMLIKTSQR